MKLKTFVFGISLGYITSYQQHLLMRLLLALSQKEGRASLMMFLSMNIPASKWDSLFSRSFYSKIFVDILLSAVKKNNSISLLFSSVSSAITSLNIAISLFSRNLFCIPVTPSLYTIILLSSAGPFPFFLFISVLTLYQFNTAFFTISLNITLLSSLYLKSLSSLFENYSLLNYVKSALTQYNMAQTFLHPFLFSQSTANTIVLSPTQCPTLSLCRHSLWPTLFGSLRIKSYIRFSTTIFRKSCCSKVLVRITWFGMPSGLRSMSRSDQHFYLIVSYLRVRRSLRALEFRAKTTSWLPTMLFQSKFLDMS